MCLCAPRAAGGTVRNGWPTKRTRRWRLRCSRAMPSSLRKCGCLITLLLNAAPVACGTSVAMTCSSSNVPTRPNAFRHVRCRLCGIVLPGWLPVPNAPDGAMLLSHLSRRHRGEVQPLLERMATEDIGTVAMESFERVPGDRSGEGTE